MAELTKEEVTELVLSEFLERDITDVRFKWNGNKSRHGFVSVRYINGKLVPTGLELSEVLFNALDDKWDIVDTVYHELAHIIAVNLYGEAGANHGKLWQSVARKLGCTARRCSSVKIDTAKMNYKYTVSCPNECFESGISKLGRIWKNTMLGRTDGYAYYSCEHCNELLTVKQNY